MYLVCDTKLILIWIFTLLGSDSLRLWAAHLPLQAVGAGGVASLQEAGGGGPAGRVLPGWRLVRLDPRLHGAERPVDGHQGGVAAAPDMERHI